MNINNSFYLSPDAPFSGWGISGLGSEHGIAGFRDYLRVKTRSSSPAIRVWVGTRSCRYSARSRTTSSACRTRCVVIGGPLDISIGTELMERTAGSPQSGATSWLSDKSPTDANSDDGERIGPGGEDASKMVGE